MTEAKQMEKRKRSSSKKMKRWVKWLIVIILVLLLLVIMALCTGYWYVKSVSLDDIKSRQQLNDNSTSTVESVKIPGVIEGAVEKATSLVGKDIEGQDALDAMAILLNSGLSLRNIKYLQGNATYDLTTEEKQHIRKLLLEKLKPDEIELLRAISSKYGKTLRILDSEFPIEWVGERDPVKIKEYDRKWDELKKSKAIEQNSNKETEMQGKESKKENDSTTISIKDASDNTGLLNEQVSAKKKEIDKEYDQELTSLKTICTAKSNALLQAILADLESNPNLSLSKLQAKFLGQLADAESTCDSQFSQLHSQAQADYKTAGIPASSMPNWESEYNNAKVATRSNSIAAIVKQMKGK